MATCIVHYEGLFFEWSTISDAPSSRAMTRRAFEAHYRKKHGTEGMKDLPERLDRAVRNGSSAIPPMTAFEVVSCNRAGRHERELTLGEIVARYGSH